VKYVQRDGGGAVVGVYENPQPQEDGSCLTDPEPLRDDAPEVVAFMERTARVPDIQGFVSDIKTAVGGIVASNALARAYPLFYPALEKLMWADATALIVDAHTSGALTDQAYAMFKASAKARNLPINLP